MPTYRTAPNLGKPPAPHLLTKRARKASALGAEAMRVASLGRKWGSTEQRNLEARRAAAADELRAGPHPLPVERIGLVDLKGSAGGLARYAVDLGLTVVAGANRREVEVRVGREGVVLGRAVFREGRLVHAFALVDGSMRKRTLTALKAQLAEAAS